MAITVTTLQATSAVAADRITINDNFSTVVSSINELLAILNTTTGKFDNTGVNTNNVVVTEGITITTSGIDITAGNISATAGNILLNADESYVQIGSANNQIAEKLFAKSSSGNFSGLDISTFDLLKLPRLTTTEIADINTSNLVGGEMVYDTTANVPKLYNATLWKTIAFV